VSLKTEAAEGGDEEGEALQTYTQWGIIVTVVSPRNPEP